MRRFLRMCAALWRIGSAEALAYRASLFVWILTSTFPLISLALWAGLARSGPIGSYDGPAFVAYFVAAFLVRQLSASWVVWDLDYKIRTGELSPMLMRPVHPVLHLAAMNLSTQPLRMAIAFPLGLVVLWTAGGAGESFHLNQLFPSVAGTRRRVVVGLSRTVHGRLFGFLADQRGLALRDLDRALYRLVRLCDSDRSLSGGAARAHPLAALSLHAGLSGRATHGNVASGRSGGLLGQAVDVGALLRDDSEPRLEKRGTRLLGGGVMMFRLMASTLAAQLRISILAALQYRTGFWTSGVLGVSWGVLGAAPLWVALRHRPEVEGWGPWELLILTGFFFALSGIFSTFLQPALTESMNHIRRGSLDYLLLRPVGALFSCLTCSFNPWQSLEFLVGFAMIAVGCSGLESLPSLGWDRDRRLFVLHWGHGPVFLWCPLAVLVFSGPQAGEPDVPDGVLDGVRSMADRRLSGATQGDLHLFAALRLDD